MLIRVRIPDSVERCELFSRWATGVGTSAVAVVSCLVLLVGCSPAEEPSAGTISIQSLCGRQMIWLASTLPAMLVSVTSP